MISCLLKVKVVPGASRTRVVGWLGEELKIAVAAPPEGGKANAAVCELLAKTLGLGRGDVTVASGQTRARKVLSVMGVTAETVHEKLRQSGVQ